jgi:hypothetical protein
MIPQLTANFQTLDYNLSGPKDLNLLDAAKFSFIILYFPLTVLGLLDHASQYREHRINVPVDVLAFCHVLISCQLS